MCVCVSCVCLCASLCAIKRTLTHDADFDHVCVSPYTRVSRCVTLCESLCRVWGKPPRVLRVPRVLCAVRDGVGRGVSAPCASLRCAPPRPRVSCGAVSRHARPQEHIGTRRTNHTRPKGSQPPGSRQPAARSQADRPAVLTGRNSL